MHPSGTTTVSVLLRVSKKHEHETESKTELPCGRQKRTDSDSMTVWSGLTCAGAVDGSVLTHIIYAEDPGAQQVLIGAVGRSVGRRPADERQQNNEGERAHPYDGSTADRQWYITVVIADQTQGYKRVSFSSFHLRHSNSLLTSRLQRNLYSDDHMTRVTWHASERAQM